MRRCDAGGWLKTGRNSIAKFAAAVLRYLYSLLLDASPPSKDLGHRRLNRQIRRIKKQRPLNLFQRCRCTSGITPVTFLQIAQNGIEKDVKFSIFFFFDQILGVF